MSRNKGTFAAPFNFEVKTQEALDPRVIVQTKTDLINKETWPYDGDTLYLYNGLIVSVAADKSLYMLVDIVNALSTDYSGWKQLDASAATSTEVIDNLTTQSTTAALSANQGYILDGKISEINTKLSAIYTPKGSVDTFDDLPTDAEVGHVYNVIAAHGNIPAGTNYVWTGTAWDALGGSVDLTNYVTKEVGKSLVADEKIALIDTNAADIDALETALANEVTARQGADTALDNRLSVVEASASGSSEAIDALELSVEDHGTRIDALETTVADNKTEIDAEITALSGTVTANKTATDAAIATADGKATTAQNEVDALEIVVADNKTATDAAIATAKSTADAAAAAIATLNGTGEGSVSKQITDALSWIEV